MVSRAIKTYYQLTKPGIIYGNLLTATAGFLLASRGQVNLGLLLATLAGTSLVIASACVFNNYIDRRVDAMMARTRSRALVSGLISGQSAIIYATVLGLAGVLLLAMYTNSLTVGIGLVAFIDYVILYGIFKRHSPFGTIVGSISGAASIVAGYTAVTARFDTGAFLLFLILVLWQMPHFYAIAIYRFDDYAAAKIPVLPVKKGVAATKLRIPVYIVAFIMAATMLTSLGYAGYVYLTITVGLGLTWLWLSLQGYKTPDTKLWARQMFRFSLLVITGLSLGLAADAWLR